VRFSYRMVPEVYQVFWAGMAAGEFINDAAAAWILAFNARCQAALIDHGFCGYATIALVRHHQEDYLSLSWH
jgi:hypothetical protein